MNKVHCSGVGVLGAVMAIAMAALQSVHAQDILRFRDGYLTFTNGNPELYYRVEFKPNLSGVEEWDGTYNGLRNIHSADPEVTVPVGVFYRVAGRDSPWIGGTAMTDDILTGKTAYVNDQEVTGTMANVGQTNLAPGTVAQTIPQGYHDGTGTVAGDSDLVAENIKKDVVIFGATGTLYNAAVQKTGQTALYREGDDGHLQKGVAWPNPRFTDHGDGTVTDKLTGLMWTKNANLDGSEVWPNAIDYCNNMNSGAGTYGYTDWRLPNVRELQSLIDYGRYNPALPWGHPFTNIQGIYWSSSTEAADMGSKWAVSLELGIVMCGAESDTSFVWPVRGGQ